MAAHSGTHLRNALADQRDLRDVFLALFPSGLTFTPDRSPDGGRQVWRITGSANLGSLVDQSGPDYVATPTGFEELLNTGQQRVTDEEHGANGERDLGLWGAELRLSVTRSLLAISLAISLDVAKTEAAAALLLLEPDDAVAEPEPHAQSKRSA